jgi:predicted transcriptional regulator
MNTALKSKAPSRKPAQLEMIGGKSSRQRIWEELRKQKGEFEMYPLASAANVDDETLKTYLYCLTAGGFVEVVKRKRYDKTIYRRIKDNGVEAPRLTRKGEPVKQGLISEAIWRTLRIQDQLDARVITNYVEAAGHETTMAYVKRYLGSLKKAGYLQVVRKGNTHSRLEVIRLKPGMDTGPRAPQVQRVKTVYDPNLNKVMHCEDPEELS